MEVANRSGVSQNAISDLETGQNTNPTWQVLSRIAKTLETTPDALMRPPATEKIQRNGDRRRLAERRQQADCCEERSA